MLYNQRSQNVFCWTVDAILSSIMRYLLCLYILLYIGNVMCKTLLSCQNIIRKWQKILSQEVFRYKLQQRIKHPLFMGNESFRAKRCGIKGVKMCLCCYDDPWKPLLKRNMLTVCAIIHVNFENCLRCQRLSLRSDNPNNIVVRK